MGNRCFAEARGRDYLHPPCRSPILSRKRTRNSRRSGIRRATRGSRRRMCGRIPAGGFGGSVRRDTNGPLALGNGHSTDMVAPIVPANELRLKIRLPFVSRISQRNGIQLRTRSVRLTSAPEVTAGSFGSARKAMSGKQRSAGAPVGAGARNVRGGKEPRRLPLAPDIRTSRNSGILRRTKARSRRTIPQAAMKPCGGSANAIRPTFGRPRFARELRIRSLDARVARDRAMAVEKRKCSRYPTQRSPRNGTPRKMESCHRRQSQRDRVPKHGGGVRGIGITNGKALSRTARFAAMAAQLARVSARTRRTR